LVGCSFYWVYGFFGKDTFQNLPLTSKKTDFQKKQHVVFKNQLIVNDLLGILLNNFGKSIFII